MQAPSSAWKLLLANYLQASSLGMEQKGEEEGDVEKDVQEAEVDANNL